LARVGGEHLARRIRLERRMNAQMPVSPWPPVNVGMGQATPPTPAMVAPPPATKPGSDDAITSPVTVTGEHSGPARVDAAADRSPSVISGVVDVAPEPRRPSLAGGLLVAVVALGVSIAGAIFIGREPGQRA